MVGSLYCISSVLDECQTACNVWQYSRWNIFFFLPELEKRTGKAPWEVIRWKWQRQKDDWQGKRGEEREERGILCFSLWGIEMTSVWNIAFIHCGVSFVLRKRRKRGRNPTGWGETSRPPHTHTHIYTAWLLILNVVLHFPSKQITLSLMNLAVIMFWSSILHLPLLHRVLIPLAVPPQNLKTRYVVMDYYKKKHFQL